MSKNEVDHRRVPRAPQGRFWDDFGSHVGDFLVYFSVFPCVYYVFQLKNGVFPCVYDDSTLCFVVVFKRPICAVFGFGSP